MLRKQRVGLAHREEDQLGGRDIYSSSKACSELITSSFQRTFFQNQRIGIATVRAGNVIGGGDWSSDRLIPDFINSILNNETLKIRNPNATRPWQHVLAPITGYLMLAEMLVYDETLYAGAWNFGPDDKDIKSVSWIADELCQKVTGAKWEIQKMMEFSESQSLNIDSSKSKKLLNWDGKWQIGTALEYTFDWYHSWNSGLDMKKISISQIEEYLS